MSFPDLLSGQESLVPEGGLPILAFLGVCLVLLIVLSPMAVVQTRRGRAVAQSAGIRVEGVRAYKVLKLGMPSEMLREKIRSIVRNERRFSRVEETRDGVRVFVRGNMWTWGEVIEVTLTEKADGTEVNTMCRPRLSTTLFDYSQSGNDLGLFIDLLVQRVESTQPGDESEP